MKFWIKILVALLVVVTIGFAVWAFFFREKDEVAAYNKTADFVNYKHSLNLDSKLNELSNLNYVHGDSDLIITSDSQVGSEILTLKEQCLSSTDIVLIEEDVEIYRYQSYLRLEEITDDIILSYLPYLNSSVVNNSAKKKVLKAVDDYITKIGNFSIAIDETIDCQNEIGLEVVELEFLKSKYSNLKMTYRKSLNSACGLILAMQDYANVCLYNDDIKIDSLNMCYDSFARLLSAMTEIDEREEIDYAKSVNRAYKRILGLYAGNKNIYYSYSEYDVLSSYTLLLKDHVETLNLIFDSRDYDKTERAKGNNLSLVKTELYPHVQLVLKSLGY